LEANLKKYILFSILIQFIIFGAYASGNADTQSRTLLYKQKRTVWEGAPDSAVFYEVFLANGRNAVFLLDVAEVPFESSLVIINPEGSMEIDVQNASSILRRNDLIYKCVVLYTGQLMGMAIVNIFSAEPIEIREFGFIEDQNYFNFIANYFDEIDLEKEFISPEQRRGVENKIWVMFPNDTKIILIDQWPNPTEFIETNLYSLLDESYSLFLQEHQNISSLEVERARRAFYNYRNWIQNWLEQDIF
jgi:hypothetical protein